MVTKARVEEVREADGYGRTRYRGQGRRGAPPRVAEDAFDVRAALVELDAAYRMLVDAQASDLMPSERRRQHREAIEHVRLAERFAIEVIGRAARSRDL